MFTQFCGHYLIHKNLLTKEQFDEIAKSESQTRVKLGLIAVSERFLTDSQASEINRLQATMDRRFGDLAIEKGYLTHEQVACLLDLQGNPYLSFIQTVIDKKYLTLTEIEKALTDYQEEFQMSDEDMTAIKSGDIDKTASAFIKIEDPYYADLFGLALRNIVRFITPRIYMDKVYQTNAYSFAHLSSQQMQDDHNVFLGIAGEGNALLSIACPFAQEEFATVDEDVYDAVCEFINVINGLFASELSKQKIEIDMLPPLFYSNQTMKSNKQFYILPVYITGVKVEIIISIDYDFEII
jgi:CheY-specific phosphatase CheX